MRFAILLLFLLISAPDGQAASCGAGCQKAMGSCRVNEALWGAAMTARQAGLRVTSCCRSPAYNRRLRACGYFPSPSSTHMSGNAIDLIISPRLCKREHLRAYGFDNVCPDYHYGHCHITQCGTPRTYQAAQRRAREEVRRIREQNRRSPPVPPVRPRPGVSPQPAQTRNNSGYTVKGWLFETPPWWDEEQTGVQR